MKILTVKNSLRAAIVTTSLCMIASVGAKNFDATVSLAEPAEGSSTWTVGSTGLIVPDTVAPNNLTINSQSAEYISVSGFTPFKLPGDENSTHWGILLETDGKTISDILRLDVANGKTGNDPAHFTLQMWSDDSDGFGAAVKAALAAQAPSMKETGAPQAVAGKFLFNDSSDKFEIFVTSDAEDPGIPPEGNPGTIPDGGATMLLLGGGVSALALLRRKLS